MLDTGLGTSWQYTRCEHNSSSAWVRRYLRPGPVLDDSNTCDNIRGSLRRREAGSRVCTKSAVTEVSPAPAPGNTHSVVCGLCLLTGIRNLSTSHLTLDHNYIALQSANTIAIITITLPLFDIQSCLDISRCWSVWRLQYVTAGSMQQCCSALRLAWHASTDWPGTVQPRTLATVQCTVHCTLYILSSHAARTLTSVPNFPTPASHNPLWRSFNYCFMTLHHLRLQSVSSGGWGWSYLPPDLFTESGDTDRVMSF